MAAGFRDAQDDYVRQQLDKLKLERAQDEWKRQQDVMKNSGTLMRAQEYLQSQPQIQPPPPGQQSQPQQQPRPPMGGGGMPPPFAPGMAGPPQGGMPQMGGRPPMGMPGQMPPYQAPQAPQQPQPQAQEVPKPPQGGQMGQPGMYSATQLAQTIQKMNPGIDPETVIRLVERNASMLNIEGRMALQFMKEKLAEKESERKTGQGDRGLDIKQEQQDRLKATAQGENKLGAAKIGLMGAQAEAAKARANRPAASSMKPGKPVMFQDENGQTFSQVLMPDGSIITRDASGRPVEGGVRRKGAAGQETMRNTVQLDLSEVDYSLENMSKDGTASLFFMDHGDKGALTRWRDNKLTPTEMQQYDVYANRIASAIAGIQSMGRGQVSDEKIRQAQKLVPQPGDEPATIQAKKAAIKRIRDNAAAIMGGKKADDLRGAPAALSPEDQAAVNWAKSHPNDPRAKKILEMHPGAQ